MGGHLGLHALQCAAEGESIVVSSRGLVPKRRSCFGRPFWPIAVSIDRTWSLSLMGWMCQVKRPFGATIHSRRRRYVRRLADHSPVNEEACNPIGNATTPLHSLVLSDSASSIFMAAMTLIEISERRLLFNLDVFRCPILSACAR